MAGQVLKEFQCDQVVHRLSWTDVDGGTMVGVIHGQVMGDGTAVFAMRARP